MYVLLFTWLEDYRLHWHFWQRHELRRICLPYFSNHLHAWHIPLQLKIILLHTSFSWKNSNREIWNSCLPWKLFFTQNCILQLMSRQSRPGIQDDLCETRQKLKALSLDKSLVWEPKQHSHLNPLVVKTQCVSPAVSLRAKAGIDSLCYHLLLQEISHFNQEVPSRDQFHSNYFYLLNS